MATVYANVYGNIYEWIDTLLKNYTVSTFINKSLSAEYLKENVSTGILVKKIEDNLDTTDIVGNETYSLKFMLTSNQQSVDFNSDKIDMAVFLDGLREYVLSEFETNKPELIDNYKAISLSISGFTHTYTHIWRMNADQTLKSSPHMSN